MVVEVLLWISNSPLVLGQPNHCEVKIAALESIYVEHVKEMTRREMEMAQSDTRARQLWEQAHEEVVKAEKIKERAIGCMNSGIEISCHACRKKFRP